MSMTPPPYPSDQPYPMQPTAPKPDNFLIWSILATIFCCLPLGVVGIVFAAQVDSKWATGDYAGAAASADNAKKWTIASAVVGVAAVAFWLLFVVVLGVVGGTTPSGY